MPLTKREQATFERMFDIRLKRDKGFLKKLAGVLFECTGNVNLTMRLFCIADRLRVKN